VYGLIVKITAVFGRRDDLIAILKEIAADMTGCLSLCCGQRLIRRQYPVGSEVWDSAASHDASFSLPSIKNAIPQAKAIVSSFTKIAVTTPTWGVGLEPTQIG
jgi:quinol monooxygenase YgiN